MADAIADINGGKMDGFVGQIKKGFANCHAPDRQPALEPTAPDVVWAITPSRTSRTTGPTRNFVLQDHMFEPVASWSLPEHLFLVSGWSAICTRTPVPGSCQNAAAPALLPRTAGPHSSRASDRRAPIYAWTDLTYLLHKHQRVLALLRDVSGTEPDCENDAAMSCAPIRQNAKTRHLEPVALLRHRQAEANGQLSNIQSSTNFYAAAKGGTLPAVLGSCRVGRSASTRRRPSAPASATSPASSTR